MPTKIWGLTLAVSHLLHNYPDTHKSAQSLDHKIGVAQKIILKSYTRGRSTVASMIEIKIIFVVHNDRYAINNF